MKKKIVIIPLIIILILLTIGTTLALYKANSIHDYYLNSKGFYFENDYNETIKVYNFWDGNEIEFNVTNSKNSKYTEDDISYTVKCIVPNGVVCKVNGGTNEYNSTLEGGKTSIEKIYLEVETEDKDIEVQVVTKSIAPYKKTITNTILLHKDDDVVGSFDYKLENYDNYSLLNISNYYNEKKCFDVKWNNTDLRVSVNGINVISSDSNGYINEFTKEIPKNETVSIKFYNQGNTTYSEELFKISECSLES